MSDSTPIRVEPAIFVIFGITGDLAKRMLMPALYHLIKDGLFDEHTVIVGASRRPLEVDDLAAKLEAQLTSSGQAVDPDAIATFRRMLRTVEIDPLKADDYDALLKTLNAIEDEHGVCMNRLYYLAIPPQVYRPLIANFGKHGLNKSCQHGKAATRLLVEKPFGYDLESATELIESTAKYFKEDQVFRIDHYLAKETAQNILVFRNQNPVFAGVWNNQHVSSIDIFWSEPIGVEGRAEFYDNIGALRDVVQNHLLQLLALVTMDRYQPMDSTHLHRAKQALLEAIRAVDPAVVPVVRAQYAGYQQDVDNPGSTTETYVRVPLEIDNDHWRGVPITISAGKALNEKRTAIVLTFTDKAHTGTSNTLTFRIQPNEGIDLTIAAKRPGFDDKIDIADMDFSYQRAFSDTVYPAAYERVLLDAVRGDRSLFATNRDVLEGWRIFEPVIRAWENDKRPIQQYERGSTASDIK